MSFVPSTHRRRIIAAMLVAVAQVILVARPAPAVTLALADDFNTTALNTRSWRPWWGQATVHNGAASLASRAPRDLATTYSALVTSRKSFTNGVFKYTASTIRPLRQGDKPNTWEVAWSMFRFRDLENYYYFIIKPNGWELGKKHGSDAQIFLATGGSPRAEIGRANKVRIAMSGGTVSVSVDGVFVARYTDPKPITSGAVGLYEEDAHVHFDTVRFYTP